MFCRRSDGYVFLIHRHDEPVLQLRHGNFPTAEFVFELRAHFGRFEQFKTLAMRCIANHDVIALFAELVGQPLHLVNAVRFMVLTKFI